MLIDLFLGAALTSMQATAAAPIGPGVSEALAAERRAVIQDLRYDLNFRVPAERRAPVQGRVTARFVLKAPHRVVLDFAQPRDRVARVLVNGRATPSYVLDGHLVVPAEQTRAGANDVTVEFVSGDEALNRDEEFLYTLFVPARAQLAFPCFDQPDLKARYTLSLEVPDSWQAVANGREVDSASPDSPVAGRKRVSFSETQPLPTYLFAFVAGKFSVETATRNGRPMRLFHRETDASKVARNRDAIFDLHARSLAWLEDYTAIPYPFGKFDIVLIPSFQFSGMEHAGAILYNQASQLLDESATQNQLLDRATTIAHETAHMWFGDLVTMKWFDDVWMKEVFANFMAAKIVNPSFPEVNHELRFLLAHYPSAYQVDRTAGTNPIRQHLANLNEAGQLYGPIIYQKAPIVMRQLETMLGEQPFRDGLREYLKRYSFGNATWLDLVRILDARTPENVSAWSRAWVEERGRPEFTIAVSTDTRSRISSMTLTMTDPLQRGFVWPQRIRVALGDGERVRLLPVAITGRVTQIPAAIGLERPRYVLPNGAGIGYGLFVLDDASRTYLLDHVEEIPDALTRGSGWVTLWDNLLEGRVRPGTFIDSALRSLPREPDEQNAQRVLSSVVRAFWKFLPDAERMSRSAVLEASLRQGLDRAATQSQKAAWFNAYRDTVLSGEGVAWLERIWRREEKVPGLTFAEPDEITMALELAVREVPNWKAILDAQLARTQNPDRKARLAFVIPALSADPAVREQAFARFQNVENRRREPWVLESIAYLNHPLRQAHATRFVRQALDLLLEIRRTGDIFFPTRWMESTLAGHRSPEVAATVRKFLAENPRYPERLRWIVLTAADELFRATR
jgi:aminopeptidase N